MQRMKTKPVAKPLAPAAQDKKPVEKVSSAELDALLAQCADLAKALIDSQNKKLTKGGSTCCICGDPYCRIGPFVPVGGPQQPTVEGGEDD